MSAIKFIGVVLAMAVCDVCWAHYSIEAAARKAHKAAFWAVLIVLTGSGVTMAYISDPRYMIAAMIGAYAGTYFTVKHKK